MIKKTKIFAVLTALCLAFTLFCACGEREEKPEPIDPDTPSPPQETMQIEDYIDRLSRDGYSADVAGSYGLSDEDNVGVVKENVVAKYSVEADSEFQSGAIFTVETYRKSGDADDTNALNDAITAAKAWQTSNNSPVKLVLPDRKVEISVEKSDYSEGPFAYVLNGFNGLSIVGGENTELCMQVANAWVGGFSFVNCQNVSLDTFAIDYAVSPTLGGKVVDFSIDELTVTIELPEEQNASAEYLKAHPSLLDRLCSYVEYDGLTGAPKARGNTHTAEDGYFAGCQLKQEGSKWQVTVSFNSSYASSFVAPLLTNRAAIGFAMYGGNALSFSRGSDITLENIAIYSCPGMAVVVSGAENFAANCVHIGLKEDGRLMSSTADGFHLEGCTGEVSITNSVIENTHDDALNIKCGYWYILNTADRVANQLTIARKTGAVEFKQGDRVAVFNEKTFAYVDEYEIREVSGSGSTLVLTVNKKPNKDLTNGDSYIVTNVSLSPSFTFANNVVRNKRNRGILVQVRDALIENNTFSAIGHGAISLHSSLDQFNEATMPKNAVIRNNKFMNNGFYTEDALRGDISAYAITASGEVAPPETITGIRITNNFFYQSGKTGISLRGAGTAESFVKDNLFYNCARYVYDDDGMKCCVELNNVSNLSIEGNYSEYTGSDELYSGIITAGLTDTDTIALKDNHNFGYQEITGDISDTNVHKLSSAITMDGSLSDWTSQGTEISMIGASLATGEKITREEYQNYFDVLSVKIGWTDEGIYFAFSVKDATVKFGTPDAFWQDDSIELFMSNVLTKPSADFVAYKQEGDIFQMAFAPTWANNLTVYAGRSNTKFVSGRSQFEAKVVTTGAGYDGEIFIPFSLADGAKANIDKGEPVAFCICFAEADHDLRMQVANVPHFVENYKVKTALMPQYYFVP